MLKVIRTNFDRREQRRDRRYAVPPIVVTIGQSEYTTLDWSLGGFLLSTGLDFIIGEQIEGELRFASQVEGFPFTAEAVRRDDEPRATAFRFVERTDAMVTALDRAIVGRLTRRPS